MVTSWCLSLLICSSKLLGLSFWRLPPIHQLKVSSCRSSQMFHFHFFALANDWNKIQDGKKDQAKEALVFREVSSPSKRKDFLNKIKNNNNKTTGNMVWQIFTTEKHTWNLMSIFPVSELLQQEVVQVIYIASTL